MLNLKINYYSHSLLNSKYSLLIKLVIMFSIYALFYADNFIGVIHCVNENDPKYQEFLNINYTLCPVQHEYTLADGRIVRHAAGKIFEIADRLEGIPERRDELYYLHVNPKEGVVSFRDIYIPPHHPTNGFKPVGEIVREHNPVYVEYEDIPWTLKMCNIL